MKAKKEDFTSVVAHLLRAGNVGYKIHVAKSVGSFLKAKKDYVWFPALQVIISVDTNTTFQIRRDDDGWWCRVNRKNRWYQVSGERLTPAGNEFAKLMDVEYGKYLNQIMTGDSDAIAKRSSLQSGDGRAQA